MPPTLLTKILCVLIAVDFADGHVLVERAPACVQTIFKRVHSHIPSRVARKVTSASRDLLSDVRTPLGSSCESFQLGTGTSCVSLGVHMFGFVEGHLKWQSILFSACVQSVRLLKGTKAFCQ